MNIYMLTNPDLCFEEGPTPFKGINISGTWRETKCKGGVEHAELISPLQFEMTPEGKAVGDVAWGYGGYEFVCSKTAYAQLNGIGGRFKAHPVEVSFGRLKVGGARYEEIASKGYVWPLPKKTISIDAATNHLAVSEECSCGFRSYEFKSSRINFGKPRLDACDAFTVFEIGDTSPVFVTKDFKEKMRELKMSRFNFRLAGRSIEIDASHDDALDTRGN